MIVYFTGTGNSRYIALMLAQLLDDTAMDAGEFLKEEKMLTLQSQKPWVFVSPTYAWQIPRVFFRQLVQGSFIGNRQAYFIMTCGDSIGNAQYAIQKLCQQKNWDYQGVLRVCMPENYIAMFDVPPQQIEGQIIEEAQNVIKEAVKEIGAGKPLPEYTVTWKDRFLSGVVNSIFYAIFVKDKAFYANQKCVSCGKCVKMCMMNNITMEKERPVWCGKCTHCMACICSCPMQAIEYGKKSQGKRRYLCRTYDD